MMVRKRAGRQSSHPNGNYYYCNYAITGGWTSSDITQRNDEDEDWPACCGVHHDYT